MNKIVFFTSRFPFRTVGENFFESELNGVAKGFDEVYIVTCNNRQKNPELLKKLPDNTTAVSAGRESYRNDIIKGVFSLPFTCFFWKELLRIFKGKYPFLPSLKSLIYSGSFYLSIKRCFPRIASSLKLCEDDNVIFVGYWLGYTSRAILDFKKYVGHKNAKAVARAHGSADVQNFTNPRQFYPFQQYLLENLDGVFAVSEGGCQYLKSISPYPERVEKIYIGSYGANDYVKRSRSPFTVMTCSNLFPLKRVGLVGEAVRLLKKEIPDIKWVHFGDGPLREKLERDLADVEDSVTFYGYTPHDEVLKYLENGQASVFVSASATEGLPISVIEAAAHCVPVIATDVGSTREIAVSGVSGTLIDPEINAKQLANEILTYYKMSDDEYEKISRSAFELFRKEFDCEKNAEVFLKALKEV